MRPSSERSQKIPLNIVGSSTFGRYPKISKEKTYNMIISDNFLVSYAGYLSIPTSMTGKVGRGIFSSNRADLIFAVVDNELWKLQQESSLSDSTVFFASRIASLNTYQGDVFMEEDLKHNIGITDGSFIYIYNYVNNTFNIATTNGSALDFMPGYITFQTGQFVVAALNTPTWRLQSLTNPLDFPAGVIAGVSYTGTLQTKPDNVVAVVRAPSRGNYIYIMGSVVTEIWTNVGAPTFPYIKNTSYNIDFGCINSATIATLDNIMVWLGINEKSGPTIMYTTGAEVKQIPNDGVSDGINFLFASLQFPQNSEGSLIKQDGHIIYQLTFPADNVSIIYDFTTGKFFHVTDENGNYHIARRFCFFNDSYYFVSLNDGNLYEFSTKYTNLNGNIMPRTRICSHERLPDSSRFIVNSLTLTMEQGDGALIDNPRLDLSVSKDGGDSFGNIVSKELNQLGVRPNRIIFWRLGQAENDLVAMFTIWSLGRAVLTDGVMSIYQ